MSLNREVLGRAFEQRLASLRRGTANPFHDAGAGRRDAGDEQEMTRADRVGRA